MLEKFNKPNQMQGQSREAAAEEDARNEEARNKFEDGHPRNPDRSTLTTSDLAGARVPEDESIVDEEVTIAEAYNLNSEPEPTRRPNATPVASGRAGSVPAGSGAAAAAAPAPAKEQVTPLFSQDEAAEFRARWDAIQVGFVDEPRHSVEQADNLVAETMRRLAEIFADERDGLEHEWDRGADVSTEDLRVALRRYRSFFGRLLSM